MDLLRDLLYRTSDLDVQSAIWRAALHKPLFVVAAPRQAFGWQVRTVETAASSCAVRPRRSTCDEVQFSGDDLRESLVVATAATLKTATPAP